MEIKVCSNNEILLIEKKCVLKGFVSFWRIPQILCALFLVGQSLRLASTWYNSEKGLRAVSSFQRNWQKEISSQNNLDTEVWCIAIFASNRYEREIPPKMV